MVLMNIFQRYLRPTEAAVVYTSEPVFAAIFAVLFIGMTELPGLLGLLGAALMLGANLLVALKPRKLPPVKSRTTGAAANAVAKIDSP